MICPSCGSKLDREDYGAMKDGGDVYHKPEALYWCDDCGYVGRWILGYPLMAWNDSAELGRKLVLAE